ncbi:retrovirus-related pol polyprotein from transposon TNT 1-94 [Tanacetum coccineum]
MNKRDETGIVIKNKARLVAQCYNQQEGIDYDGTFAPVALLEAVRIFLAFSTYINFIVYQIDVKSSFLNGKLKEEVYVKQAPGFESSEFPNHVCKLDNALYGLKQAPRACKPKVFKAPKPSSNAERVPQGTKPRAKPRHKLHSASSKQSYVSSSEVTKGRSSKAPIGSKTSHLKRKKESSSAMDSIPSQTSASTPVVVEMHKEDQQATGNPKSLGVTNEERSNPQLNSDMLAFNINEPIFLASFIIHSESALGYDALADSTAKADHGLFAPNDSIPQQQGMDEETKNTSFNHIFAGTNPHVLADQTQSVSEGLETVLTQPITGKGSSSIARQVEEDKASRTIKMEDLAKMVQNIQPSFKYLDSPEDDPIIVVDSDEDEEADKDELHATLNI